MSVAMGIERPPEPVPMIVLPPIVRQKIAAFLAAGYTGQIVLDVKEGRVLAYKLTEAGRVSAKELDIGQVVMPESL